jgi:hypothetical protein
VLQSICLLICLDTSPALTKAKPIKSIKTAIAAPTDLQDPRFCDLGWDDSGRGHRKHCKFATALVSLGVEDSDDEEDVLPMDNEGDNVLLMNNQSIHGVLCMRCPRPSSCSLPFLAGPLSSKSPHICTPSPIPFALRCPRPLPARLTPRSAPNTTCSVALPSSLRPPELSVSGPLRINPLALPAYQGSSINNISISSLAAPPSTPCRLQPPRMAPWSPYCD